MSEHTPHNNLLARYGMSILSSKSDLSPGEYHGCWCSGNFRSQGISRHGIDLERDQTLNSQ